MLALTIALETGDISRFATPGNFASYARTVDSRRESNGKKKGEGNTKCGNKHLAWAFIEAAHFAVRYDAPIKRWYQKKASKTVGGGDQGGGAQAGTRVLPRDEDGEPFETARAFS